MADLLTTPFCCNGNGVLELTINTPVIVDPYCEPEYTTECFYYCLSVEEKKGNVEMVTPGVDSDILVLRGRLLRPRHFKTFNPHQDTFCLKWKTAPFLANIATVRVIPETSSRLRLERTFGTHITMEVRANHQQFNIDEF